MKTAIFAYSRQGCRTALKAAKLFDADSVTLYAPQRFADKCFLSLENPSTEFYRRIFNDVQVMIFVGSCGIAVRSIAPHLRTKLTDPAVICVDELGHFAISLLSGHIGGANRIAARLAKILGAQAVITTATDINNRFSVDSWAARQGFAIDNIKICKQISSQILETDVGFDSCLSVNGSLPKGLLPQKNGKIGILLSWYKETPFETTLRIIPPRLHLGIGCRKGVSCKNISQAAEQVLKANNIDFRAIKSVHSIDLKAEEEGLKQFCRQNNLSFECYSADQLMQLKGHFSSSEFVKGITGADNVCERAALMQADKLIVKKTAVDGVTVAVAADMTEVYFE